jgi:hypothetical protein
MLSQESMIYQFGQVYIAQNWISFRDEIVTLKSRDLIGTYLVGQGQYFSLPLI